MRIREVLGQNKAVLEKGYTKAVDMWSVGCVTTVVLTGERPFSWTSKKHTQQSSQSAIDEAMRDCNLGGLEQVDTWQQLTGYPRDFVTKLLILDENARWTAEQALDHPWFTNEHCKEELMAVYKKAIHGWQKNMLPPDTIENIAGYRAPSVSKPTAFNRYMCNPCSRQRSVTPKQKRKKYIPIEAHYQPHHKNVQSKLFPRPTTPVTVADVRKLNERPDEPTAPMRFGRYAEANGTNTKPRAAQCEQDERPSLPCVALDFGSLPKPLDGPTTDAGKAWMPPSSQKRQLLDVIPVVESGARQRGSPTKKPSSPLRRKSGAFCSKQGLDDAFDIKDDSTVILNSPLVDRNTGDASESLSSTVWDQINRRQPMKLGPPLESETPQRAVLGSFVSHDSPLESNERGLETNKPQLETSVPSSPGFAQATKRTTEDDHATSSKRRRTLKDPLEETSHPPKPSVTQDFQIGERAKQVNELDSVQASLPADLTDSIRTAY